MLDVANIPAPIPNQSRSSHPNAFIYQIPRFPSKSSLKIRNLIFGQKPLGDVLTPYRILSSDTENQNDAPMTFERIAPRKHVKAFHIFTHHYRMDFPGGGVTYKIGSPV